MEIARDVELARDYTIKGKTIAIISNGTAVLGLGDIGPEASLPVLEGKAMISKKLAGVDVFPIIIDSKDPDEIIRTIVNISGGFGGIHLEDISAPDCFYIEEKLREKLDIPVYHDDQHGTSIAVLAGLINALKLVGKDRSEASILINGAGASGIAVANLLLAAGFEDIVLNDLHGAIVEGNEKMNSYEQDLAKQTNKRGETGGLEELIVGKDIFIGVSDGDLLDSDMVAKMNDDAIVFALANPVPEIYPEEAIKGGARIVATGRSDFPNQINNLLVFPGIFKGALKYRLNQLDSSIKIKAAENIASLIEEDQLTKDYIIPDAFDKRVVDAVVDAFI